MAKKNKFYVVWKGYNPGIYNSWTDCQIQIKGFTGALYKSYTNKKEAEQAYISGPSAMRSSKSKAPTSFSSEIITTALSVDAACSGNPGLMEYRGVFVGSEKEIFRQGPFKKGTNNIGEFLAIVHALALLKKKGLKHLQIYTDSKTAISWVSKKQCRTNLAFDSENQDILDLIKRAEKWLKENTFTNPIVKWKTKEWGEIPADFGRK